MLDLYHWEPNGASARALICLEEKGLEYSGCYVDVLAFEQFRPQFLSLNESGQVPVLTREGVPYTEASAICEYLEEAFPASPLMPDDPLGRWRVRVWNKYVDDGFAASVSELAWDAYGGRTLRELGPSAVRAAFDCIPAKDRRDAWQAAAAGLDADSLARARSRVADGIRKVETDLAGSRWLAGPGYSLADIAVFAYFKYLPALCGSVLNEHTAPRSLAWMQEVGERPAVRTALGRGRAADPYAVAAPGPEHVRWG